MARAADKPAPLGKRLEALGRRLVARLGYRVVRLRGPADLDAGGLAPTLSEPQRLTAGPPPEGELYRLFQGLNDVHKWLHYFEIYERHLAAFRAAPVTMLEIGVFRGGSLKMWKRWLHPDSRLVGVDVDEACRAHENAAEQVFVRIGDQADPAFLHALAEEFGPFDIILDDGGHTARQQIGSFNGLFREALREGGVYLVEDCHTSYWPAFQDAGRSFIDFSKELVDLLHEPYRAARSERDFRRRREEVTVPYVAANLGGIFFYDSVVVFEKTRRRLPVSELR